VQAWWASVLQVYDRDRLGAGSEEPIRDERTLAGNAAAGAAGPLTSRVNLRALRWRLASSESEPLEVSLWAGAPTTLAERQPEGVYLVVEDALPDIHRFVGLFTDRGRKHDARPLSKLLLRQPGVPFVRAAFSNVGQLKRSIRILLEKAAHLEERKAYVVGVAHSMFEKVAAGFGMPSHDEARWAPSNDEQESMDLEDVPPDLEDKLTGASPEMRDVRQRVVRAAREDYAVLVQGDTGTGKEVVARSIHTLNPTRRHQPFVAVNCGAIPRELFESQVFGYVGGAFTGALRQGSEGLWRFAKGGTIFLDEIGDLAPEHQVKILRALEERTVLPVGSTREVGVGARVIAATNRDLYSMTLSGEFREDLYYRLASLVINLPPLRDRPEDVERLANLFWKEIAPRRPPLAHDVIRELQRYRWRGNAREVRYILMNLHTTFPKSIPNVARLKAVVRMRAPEQGSQGENGSEEAMRRVDSLRHLRRARASVARVQRLVRALGLNDSDTDRRIRLLTNVGGCLTDLQLLGTRPERFEIPTFEAVHRLAGGLAVFQSLLSHNDPASLRYGKKELAGEAAAAGIALRRDEELILKSL
jgi:DNA-binding NtrC family response regulator